MSPRQRFHVMMMVFWAIVLIAMLVWMIATGDYHRLWAAELAVLCAFAIALRGYALEWRRLKDEREARK